MNIIWKPIKDFEGLYEVSNTGKVRSLDHYVKTNIRHVDKRLVKGRILKARTNKSTGYNCVTLSKGKKIYSAVVHHLVAEAFCDKKDGDCVVNHIDGNKANNAASNLEWCTYKENSQHAVQHGIFGGCKTHVKNIPVKCIETGKTFGSAKEAAEWLKSYKPNISKTDSHMMAICIRKAIRTQRISYGFHWEDTGSSTTIPKGSTCKRVEMGSPSNEGEDIV